MHTDEQMAQAAEEYLRLKSRKRDLEDRLSASEKALRAGLKERGARLRTFGSYVVSVSGPRISVTPVEKINEKPYKKDGVPF